MSKANDRSFVAGYVCQARNPATGMPAYIVDIRNGGDWAGSESEGGRYVVICEKHGALIQETSLARAKRLMATPFDFCDECRALTDAAA